MPSRSTRAQTLIELLTTIAIVTILAGLAVGSYAWVKPWVMQKLGWIIKAGDPVDMVKDK